ncbi:MAG: nucleotide pyrophosphohydrolase, partial [Desulfobulbus sp.]|nr:nucleotide pyrophosphohydrolase [Desulfobulbus sp.]
MSDLKALTAELLAFRDARDWRQFHSLRNLIVSLNLEAAELLELTQWKNDAEIAALPADSASAEALRDECADILLYLLLIADAAGIDLL